MIGFPQAAEKQPAVCNGAASVMVLSIRRVVVDHLPLQLLMQPAHSLRASNFTSSCFQNTAEVCVLCPRVCADAGINT